MLPATAISGIFSDFGTRPLHWWLLLGLCLLSRLLTSIHYIEDPDSLRFALAAIEYDVASLQPHFPGYPVFCFLLKIFYLLIGRFAYAFSVVGGLATFVLLWAAYQLYIIFFHQKFAWVFLLLLFLNPLIWLLGNRYMPDLPGAALALACLAVYTKAQQGNKKYYQWFFVLAGFLAGVRLSYVPMVLLPAFLLLLQPKRWLGIAVGAVTVLFWLLPMVLDTGFYELLTVATTHTEGHFTEWGGTLQTEPSHVQRLQRTAQFIWAHGLGAYWPGRHFSSALLGLFLVLATAACLFGKQVGFYYGEASRKAGVVWVVVGSVVVYLLWIYFYQNVVHQSRHVLPVLPLLLLPVAAGCAVVLQKMRLAGAVFVVVLFILNAWVTGVLVWQHQKPTSVYQVKEFLQQHTRPGQVIVTLDMINQYLMLQKVEGEFLSVEDNLQEAKNRLREGKPVWVIGTFPELETATPVLSKTYYHNPYVNSLWPQITLYRYGN